MELVVLDLVVENSNQNSQMIVLVLNSNKATSFCFLLLYYSIVILLDVAHLLLP